MSVRGGDGDDDEDKNEREEGEGLEMCLVNGGEGGGGGALMSVLVLCASANLSHESSSNGSMNDLFTREVDADDEEDEEKREYGDDPVFSSSDWSRGDVDGDIIGRSRSASGSPVVIFVRAVAGGRAAVGIVVATVVLDMTAVDEEDVFLVMIGVVGATAVVDVNDDDDVGFDVILVRGGDREGGDVGEKEGGELKACVLIDDIGEPIIGDAREDGPDDMVVAAAATDWGDANRDVDDDDEDEAGETEDDRDDGDRSNDGDNEGEWPC